MSTETAIAHHLGVSVSTILRIEEWANCLFAVIRGMGARFVSKKVVTMEDSPEIKKTRQEAAEAFADYVDGKTWVRGSKVRVYVTGCEACIDFPKKMQKLLYAEVVCTRRPGRSSWTNDMHRLWNQYIRFISDGRDDWVIDDHGSTEPNRPVDPLASLISRSPFHP